MSGIRSMKQETLDHPSDITLVGEGGKEFKAHRRVLSQANPFFNEGVVRLDMLTELGLRDILEFIYTGSVQISAEDNAQELIVMADYLDLSHLKNLAERILVHNLNNSNSVSMSLFAKRYSFTISLTSPESSS